MFPFAWTVNILSITTALPLDFLFQLSFFLHREHWKARQGLVCTGWEGGRGAETIMVPWRIWARGQRLHEGTWATEKKEWIASVPTYKAIRRLLSNVPQLLSTTTLLWCFLKECHPHSPVQQPISQFTFSNSTKVRVDNEGQAGLCALCQA